MFATQLPPSSSPLSLSLAGSHIDVVTVEEKLSKFSPHIVVNSVVYQTANGCPIRIILNKSIEDFAASPSPHDSSKYPSSIGVMVAFGRMGWSAPRVEYRSPKRRVSWRDFWLRRRCLKGLSTSDGLARLPSHGEKTGGPSISSRDTFAW